MSRELTDRQREIFNFIKESIHSSGFPPTIREIGGRFNITVKGAYDHLKAIEKKGYLQCSSNKSRAIELIREVGSPDGEQDTVTIPLVGRIAAGEPLLAEENIEEYLSLPRPSFTSGKYFALRVHGDSMIEKGIFDGDIAVIRKQENANNGDVVAALIDDEATLKTFSIESGVLKLIPANEAYQPIMPDNCHILGILAGIFRVYRRQ
ncbi:MAG: transcriptional repressor LexA [Spirochaetota bacterium]